MEAAIIAAKRGHDVTLYEKSGRLGGALNFAEHVDFKSDLYHLIGSMEAELAESGAKPTVVIVPMEEGHLVQPLFPYLKKTKRFYMRPGVRVRVFWMGGAD